mmetsp:Transcript_9329/g.13814  ORF Transcript_9329/g.13814 Transcript_9329/m.13814 type:complete len:914 (-) Transcript_9329:14-2755(-)
MVLKKKKGKKGSTTTSDKIDQFDADNSKKDTEGQQEVDGEINIDDFELSTTVFEALERDFQSVLTELADDEHLEKFRNEYEKLHKTLIKSHDNELRLMKKCAELNNVIVSNASKVYTALKLSQDDQNTIFQLQKEIEKAWMMVEDSTEKAQQAQEAHVQVQRELDSLQKLIDHNVGYSNNDAAMQEMKKENEALRKKIDQSNKQAVQLVNDASELQGKLRDAHDSQGKYVDEIQMLRDELVHKDIMIEQAENRAAQAEINLNKQRDNAQKNNMAIEHKNAIISTHLDTIAKLELKMTQVEKQLEMEQKAHIITTDKYSKTDGELKEKITEASDLNAAKAKLEFELREMVEEQNRLNRVLHDEARRLGKSQTEIAKLKSIVKEQQDQKKNMMEEINAARREADSFKQNLDRVHQQIDKMKLTEVSLEKKAKSNMQVAENYQQHLVMAEAQQKSLERKLQFYRSEHENMRKKNYKLEQEREQYARKGAEALSQYQNASEEIKIKTLEVNDAQAKIGEVQDKLKQQQALYEAVRTERNLYSKNLLDANEKIAELKRKHDIMNQQLTQLNDEITVNDRTMLKMNKEQKTVKEEKDKLRVIQKKLKNEIESLKHMIVEREAEISKQNQIIADTDHEREQQKAELEAVVNARDILGTQLIRRNDELALLYEKIRIQQSQLNKGSIQYRQKINDINMLKLKINEMHRSMTILQNEVATIGDLKREIHHLQRQVFEQQTKVKALSEELENPMNVHRWRKLEGSDPQQYEMILKLQSLQKRLITKTEEVMEKEKKLAEKQKVVDDLKVILKRQPGPELAEQLNLYQDKFRKNESKMKTVTSELNMYMFKNQKSNYELERVSRELSELRKSYYDLKKKEQARVAKKQNSKSMTLTRPPGQKQFIGGGFGVTTSSDVHKMEQLS